MTVHSREEAMAAVSGQGFVQFERKADGRVATADSPEKLERALDYLFEQGNTAVDIVA